jgi:alkylation response protein AidB-like acyl-CoA dehydrogenase
VRFRYDDEHDELRRSLRRLLDASAGPEAVLAAADSGQGYDLRLLTRLADEIGVYGLAVPEGLGGAGYGQVELGVVFHEAGRALLRAPLLANTLASSLLACFPEDKSVRALLPEVATGRTAVSFAVHEPGAGWSTRPTTTAVLRGGGWELTGRKDWVLDGDVCAVLVVAATTAAGPTLFLADTTGPGVTRETVPTVDLSRQVAQVELAACGAELVGTDGGAAEVLERGRALALALLAAEQTGIAERCLETATEWALQRQQFGQPIGSFQAIKHKLADARLELEAAVSASMYALWAADSAPDQLATAARIAAVTCGEAAVLSAGECIQVHGGIGVTWEHHAHLYLRRALLDQRLFGDVQTHLAGLAEQVDEIALHS